MTNRSYYLDDYSDEVMPCEPSLDGWALWLSSPDPDEPWNKEEAPIDGCTFSASAIDWLPDIVATNANRVWSFSEVPQNDDFIAVRFGEGMGWEADNIITARFKLDANGDVVLEGDMCAALIDWLHKNAQYCDDVEYIARGRSSDGWVVTYHATPPHCTAERKQ